MEPHDDVPTTRAHGLSRFQALLFRCPDGRLGSSGALLRRMVASALCCRSSGAVRSAGGVLLRSLVPRPALLVEVYGNPEQGPLQPQPPTHPPGVSSA